ncbi:emp24p/erv25p- protein [Dimargaris xerosporica]|nr:emp24p/erv25p- protein [Dimargaris xerosporica]
MRVGTTQLAAIVGLVVLAIVPIQALHFYLQNKESKCFTEDLPKHTTVTGHFKTKEWIEQEKRLIDNPSIGLQIIVEELPGRNPIVNQKSGHEGKFTFTSAKAGQHSICLHGNATSWFNPHTTQVKLDLTFGNPQEESDATTKLDTLAERVRTLNKRTTRVQEELEAQRVREVEFRDLSEKVNSHVVWYVVLQLVVLGLTCVWQVRYLRTFFVKKKLI